MWVVAVGRALPPLPRTRPPCDPTRLSKATPSSSRTVQPVQGQPGAAEVVRPGLQPGQLPAATGAAPARADLDADDAAGEADQDRREGRPPRKGRHVPI